MTNIICDGTNVILVLGSNPEVFQGLSAHISTYPSLTAVLSCTDNSFFSLADVGRIKEALVVHLHPADHHLMIDYYPQNTLIFPRGLMRNIQRKIAMFN